MNFLYICIYSKSIKPQEVSTEKKILHSRCPIRHSKRDTTRVYGALQESSIFKKLILIQNTFKYMVMTVSSGALFDAWSIHIHFIIKFSSMEPIIQKLKIPWVHIRLYVHILLMNYHFFQKWNSWTWYALRRCLTHF